MPRGVAIGATAAALFLAACSGRDEPRDTTASATSSAATSSSSTGSGGNGAGGQGGAVNGCYGASSGATGGGGDGGAGGASCAGPGSHYASRIVSACFGPGEAFGHDAFPANVLGPPKGGGCCVGSLDVCSLGNGGSITLAFDNPIVDAPGVDFIVFENAFYAGGDPKHAFAELGTVEVSADGVTWLGYPCTAIASPYGDCAGWRPVYANSDTSIDPLDPSVAGGDQYDLAELGVPLVRFVRITDRADLPGSFDLDAIAAVHVACP
jgi:hypothetical protein